MAEVGWRPTVDNYLGRVTKPRILEAVREAKGEASAQLIDHLKKGEMAKEAERLLEDTGWLPEPLRLVEVAPARSRSQGSTAGVPLRRRGAGGARDRAGTGSSLPNNPVLAERQTAAPQPSGPRPLLSDRMRRWQGEEEPGREGFELPRS